MHVNQWILCACWYCAIESAQSKSNSMYSPNFLYSHFSISAGSFCWHCHWTMYGTKSSLFIFINLLRRLILCSLYSCSQFHWNFVSEVLDATVLCSAFGIQFIVPSFSFCFFSNDYHVHERLVEMKWRNIRYATVSIST